MPGSGSPKCGTDPRRLAVHCPNKQGSPVYGGEKRGESWGRKTCPDDQHRFEIKYGILFVLSLSLYHTLSYLSSCTPALSYSLYSF